MPATHLVLLVEELSMDVFLREALPRLLPRDRTFEIHPFQGKDDLMKKLKDRLRGYASWLPEGWRIVVVVDCDDDDCRTLKRTMELATEGSGLRSRSQAGVLPWQVVNRIAIEELEAWYFGDWSAVKAAYPRVSASIQNRHGFRDPDAIAGGTWQAFLRVMQQHGYFKGGLSKLEAARAIGTEIDPSRSQSRSFAAFYQAVAEP